MRQCDQIIIINMLISLHQLWSGLSQLHRLESSIAMQIGTIPVVYFAQSPKNKWSNILQKNFGKIFLEFLDILQVQSLNLEIVIIQVSMFASDFQQTISSAAACKNPPRTKVEYAAGFRGYHPQKVTYNPSLAMTPSTNSVTDYISQIGVSGLSEVYQKEHPHEIIDDSSRVLMEQKESVVRLYRNIYPNRKQTKGENQNRENEKENSGVDLYAKDIWEVDGKYLQAPNAFIVQKELGKVHNKILSELKLQNKKQKIEPPIQFKAAISAFLLLKWKELLQAPKKAGARIDSDMQTFALWKNFLSQTNLKTILAKNSSKSIDSDILQKIRKNNRYIFSLIEPLNDRNTKFTFEKMQSLISEVILTKGNQILDHFKCYFQFTQPLQVEFKKKQNEKNLQEKVQSENEDDIELKKKVKANPIPNTTYNPPKEHNQTQFEPTRTIPFNISQKSKPVDFDQFYQWKREFKANEVPETTYKPKTAKLQSQQQKKARAHLKLSEASYPKTMQYLQKYREGKQYKKEELTQKYMKTYQKCSVKTIPNFKRAHAQQIVKFQKIAEKNKKQTKPKPFNLSQNRPKPLAEDIPIFVQNNIGRRPMSSTTRPQPAAKSTLKFQAYKNFRSKEEAQKQEKKQKVRLKKQEEERKNAQLKNIIKARMAEQLGMQPRPKNTFQPDHKHKVQIDYERMYWNRPLLMESTNPQQIKLPWESIFAQMREN